MTGTVKWFNNKKATDLFPILKEMMYSYIIRTGYGWIRSLEEGQAVEFEVTEGAKGLRQQM